MGDVNPTWNRKRGIVSLEHDPEIVSLEHDPGFEISNSASHTVFLNAKNTVYNTAFARQTQKIGLEHPHPEFASVCMTHPIPVTRASGMVST